MAKKKLQVYHGTSPAETHRIIASTPTPKDGVCLNIYQGYQVIAPSFARLEDLGLKIFMDNGSFERWRDFKKSKKISEKEYFSDKSARDYFKFVTDQYKLLLQASKHPGNLIITIPEVIGNAKATQNLQDEYMDEYKKLQNQYHFQMIVSMQFNPKAPDWVEQMKGSAKKLSRIVKPAAEDGQRVGVPFGKDFASIQKPKTFAEVDEVFQKGGPLAGRTAHLFAAGTPKKITKFSKSWVESVDASSLNLWSRDAHYVMRTTGEVVDVRDMKGIPKTYKTYCTKCKIQYKVKPKSHEEEEGEPEEVEETSRERGKCVCGKDLTWTPDQIAAANAKIPTCKAKLASEGINMEVWYATTTKPDVRFAINLKNFDAIVAGIRSNAAPFASNPHSHVFALEFLDQFGNVFSTSYRIYNRELYTLEAAKQDAENWVKKSNFSVPVRVRYIPSKKNETTKATPVSRRISTVLRDLRKTPIEEGLPYKRLEDELYLLLPPEKYGLENIQELLYEPSGKAARAKIIKRFRLSKNAFNFNAAAKSNRVIGWSPSGHQYTKQIVKYGAISDVGDVKDIAKKFFDLKLTKAEAELTLRILKARMRETGESNVTSDVLYQAVTGARVYANTNAASMSLSHRIRTVQQLLGFLKDHGITDGKSQLKRGIKIEMEHTDDPRKARRIAMDHLTEFGTYYRLKTGLPALEVHLAKQNKSSPSPKKWMYFSLSPNGLIFSMDDVRKRLSRSGLFITKYNEKLGEKNWIYEISVKVKPADPVALKRVEKSIDRYITSHTEAKGTKSIIVQASRSGDELLFIIEDGLAFLIDDYTEGPPEE
jgi:hypothetical protein